jgi:hypothetical protein
MPPRTCTAWSAHHCIACVAWFFSRHTSAIHAGDASPASARSPSVSSHACVDAMRICMSTSLWRITWCSTSSAPKVRRCRAQASASSKHACAKPSAAAASASRSPLKLSMMARKPAPSSPSRWPAGTRTPSKRTWAVSEHHQPIFSSRVRDTPGAAPGTTSSDTPAAPGAPVRTATVSQSARTPDVMNTFSPSTMNASPSRRAVVRRCATSEPPPGSVTASAAMRSPRSTGGTTARRKASLPSATIGGRAMLCECRLASTPPLLPWRAKACACASRQRHGAGVPPSASG